MTQRVAMKWRDKVGKSERPCGAALRRDGRRCRVRSVGVLVAVVGSFKAMLLFDRLSIFYTHTHTHAHKPAHVTWYIAWGLGIHNRTFQTMGLPALLCVCTSVRLYQGQSLRTSLLNLILGSCAVCVCVCVCVCLSGCLSVCLCDIWTRKKT